MPSYFPPWLKTALEEVGVAEVPGSGNNPRILEYHHQTRLNASQDDVPWCSSFANWVMRQNGVKGSGEANARSWLDWGVESKPRLGAVVVLSRSQNPALGHVGFMLAQRGGIVHLVSGNVNDQVTVDGFGTVRILGYRWPTDWFTNEIS